MPDITPNLSLKKPLGTEMVSRTAYNENLDLLDANAAPLASLTAHVAELATDDVHGLDFKGALVYLTANESIANTTSQIVNWDAETYDTSGIWEIASPSKLTVPAGVTKIRLRANVSWASNATGIRKLNITKNGGNYQGQTLATQQAVPTVGSTTDQLAVSPVLSVVAGDYFELLAQQTSGGALNIGYIASGLSNWFAMEVVQ